MLGIGKERQKVRTPDDASDLADVVLQDLSGNAFRVGDTWEERPAVLVFLRHYG